MKQYYTTIVKLFKNKFIDSLCSNYVYFYRRDKKFKKIRMFCETIDNNNYDENIIFILLICDSLQQNQEQVLFYIN